MTLKHWLSERPFTLAMSSGFFGFFAHAGVVRALEENGLRPTKYTGCSAGAIIAAAKASGVLQDELEDRLFNLKRNDFWDPGIGLGLLKGEKFEEIVSSIVKPRFEDLETPCEVVAFRLRNAKAEFIKSGPLPSAVRASCTLPGFFQATKHDGALYIDGGVTLKSAIPKDANERVFCHYLYDSNPWSWFELKRDQFLLNTNHKLHIIKKIPQVGPFKLTAGLRAHEFAYKSTLKSLQEPA